MTRGDVGSGPGWIIRHIVPATGDEDARAAWCNERNAELLADGDDTGADRTIVGGWGLMSSGECCLTTWLSPYLIAGEGVITALGLVGNVLSYQQVLVMRAIAADLDAVTGSPLTPDELAQGLSSVLTAIAASLQYAESFRWSVHPGTDDVVVVLTGPGASILLSPTMAPAPLASRRIQNPSSVPSCGFRSSETERSSACSTRLSSAGPVPGSARTTDSFPARAGTGTSPGNRSSRASASSTTKASSTGTSRCRASRSTRARAGRCSRSSSWRTSATTAAPPCV